MATRDFLFAGRTPGSTSVDIGKVILRVTLGLALALAHGIGKIPPSEGFVGMIGGMGFPAPALLAWLVALVETVGGILLAIGLLTRPAALLIVVNFIVIFFVVLGGAAFGDRELELLYLVGSLFFLFAGPGRFSIDALINRGTTRIDGVR